MKKILILSLALCASAVADLFEFGAGAGVWRAETSGTAEYKKSGIGAKFDAKDTGLDTTTNGYLWAYIEHEIPILPNFRIDGAPFSSDGTKNISVAFGGTVFNGRTKTDLTMDQIDFIGYYILPIPAIDIRLGLGAETIDGSLKLAGQGKSAKADLSFTLPIAYGGVRFEIPSIAVGLEADLKYVAYDKSRISDIRGKIDWTFIDAVINAALEVGYRSRSIEIEDLSGVNGEIDVTIKGPFVGVAARF
ncbi:MAG: TIGR04219 family outer membrane beta-barrel protein [Helicobacteraceae bacterium]|jgi:outer membrane protein|nr:TIGR04219 family outer membrane beta-barrel protein [Helicobacteraceae bacterium]